MTDRPPGRASEGGLRAVIPPGDRRDLSEPTLTLPYDQIPEERRTIGDATGRLDGHNGVLGVALAQWMARDDSRPQADARRAGSTAMDTIDAMLAELHTLRARLLGEIRVSDRLAADRADALLASLPGRLFATTGGDCLHVRDCPWAQLSAYSDQLPLTRAEAEAYLRESHEHRCCTLCAPGIPEPTWVRTWTAGGRMRWRLADDVEAPLLARLRDDSRP